MPKFKFIISALFILAAIPSCPRAESCHTSEEAEGDAALRYQAHLRVVALSCVSMASGGSLYTQYQTFIARNQSVLDEYQNRLMHYYRAHGRGDPATRMHTRDTEINNDESLNAAKSGIGTFCRVNIPQLQKAATESPEDVRGEIERNTDSFPASQGKCR